MCVWVSLVSQSAFLTLPKLLCQPMGLQKRLSLRITSVRTYSHSVLQYPSSESNLRVGIPRSALSSASRSRRTLTTSSSRRRCTKFDAHLWIPHLQRRHRSWLGLLRWLCVVFPGPGLNSRLCRRRHGGKRRWIRLIKLLRACWALVVGWRWCLLLT